MLHILFAKEKKEQQPTLYLSLQKKGSRIQVESITNGGQKEDILTYVSPIGPIRFSLFKHIHSGNYINVM